MLLYRLDDSARRVADLLQWITTIFWVFDVPATFFTATYVNDILCFRLPDIASAYLRGWFLFDMFMPTWICTITFFNLPLPRLSHLPQPRAGCLLIVFVQWFDMG